MGLPEQGSELLAKLGFDPNEAATRLLGTGLEVAGDPLAMASGPLMHYLTHGASNVNLGALAAMDDLAIAIANTRGPDNEVIADHPLANFIPPPNMTVPLKPAGTHPHHRRSGYG